MKASACQAREDCCSGPFWKSMLHELFDMAPCRAERTCGTQAEFQSGDIRRSDPTSHLVGMSRLSCPLPSLPSSHSGNGTFLLQCHSRAPCAPGEDFLDLLIFAVVWWKRPVFTEDRGFSGHRTIATPAQRPSTRGAVFWLSLYQPFSLAGLFGRLAQSTLLVDFPGLSQPLCCAPGGCSSSS